MSQRPRDPLPSLRLVPSPLLACLLALGLAACGSTPNPPPSAAVDETPVPSSLCAAAGLDLEAGPWDGAAGSRGNTLLLTNRAASSCLIAPALSVVLLDAGGRALASSEPGPRPVELLPGATRRFDVLLSNWCIAPPSSPLRVAVRLGDGMALAKGGTLAATDLPPCLDKESGRLLFSISDSTEG